MVEGFWMNRLDCAFIVPMDDVSPENDGSLKVECFSSATNLFGFLRLFEVLVE